MIQKKTVTAGTLLASSCCGRPVVGVAGMGRRAYLITQMIQPMSRTFRIPSKSFKLIWSPTLFLAGAKSRRRKAGEGSRHPGFDMTAQVNRPENPRDSIT
jgi:hypothetical protein